MTLRLVCASANADKVAEMAAALDGVVELEPRPSELGEVVEDAPDLEGNARLKAAAVCEAAGRPAIADDTGLEVEALCGAPGVTSARYAGEGASYEGQRDKTTGFARRGRAIGPRCPISHGCPRALARRDGAGRSR